MSPSTLQTTDISGDTLTNSVQIQKVYVQSFTGQNVEHVQTIFFETVAEQNLFTLLELLPDDYTGLKILRLEVTDYSIWENEELLELESNRKQSSMVVPDPVLRRNAIVRFKVSLFEAETGRLLLRKPYSQPFQQIYVGKDEIKNIPEKSLELKRLTKVLVLKLLTDFYEANSEALAIELEEGYGIDWISINIYNMGDSRLKKGNRLARVGEYERAIWMWQLVLYKAGESEPLEIYRKNRASAYYNLGVVYFKLGDWLKAAEMYSMANRMKQKLKYAQAWGNTMQMWLEAQKGEVDQINEIVNQQEMKGGIVSATKPLNAKGVITPVSDAEILKSLERNQQLLLKARELWPLEPALKFSEPPISVESNNPSLMMDEMMLDTDESELSNPDTPEKPRMEDELIRQVPVTN